MKKTRKQKEELSIKFDVCFNVSLLTIITLALIVCVFLIIHIIKLSSQIPIEAFTNNLLFLLLLGVLALIFFTLILLPNIMNMVLENILEALNKLTIKENKKKEK